METIRTLIITGAIILLAACGGGGGNGNPAGSSNNPSNTNNTSGTGNPPTDSGAVLKTGVFLDSPVMGLGYQTETQSGLTDSKGQFHYREGEAVSFRIGLSLPLGSTFATPFVTPIDLTTPSDENDPWVTNIIRLLQSLDEDNNPNNGVEISQRAHDAASGFVFTPVASVEEFENNANLFSYLSLVDKQLVDVDVARAHFRQSLRSAATQPIERAPDFVQASWSFPITLNKTTENAVSPHVVSDAQGNAVVVWLDDGDQKGIYASRYSAVNQVWQDEVLIDDGVSMRSLELDMNRDGVVIAVWIEESRVVSALFDGVMWGSPRQLSHRSSFSADVALNDNGNAVVVWVEPGEGSENQSAIMTASYSNGVWSEPAKISRDDVNDNATPRIALDENDLMTVIWYGQDKTLWTYRQNVAGGASTVFGLSGNEGSVDATVLPQMDVHSNGDVLVLWAQHDGQGSGAFISRFDTGQGQWQSPVHLDAEDSDVTFPALSACGDGKAVAAWMHDVGPIPELYAAIYKNGAWREPEQLATESGATNVKVACDDGGNAVLLFNQTHTYSVKYSEGDGWTTPTKLAGFKGLGDNDISLSDDGIGVAVWEHNVIKQPNALRKEVQASILKWIRM